MTKALVIAALLVAVAGAYIFIKRGQPVSFQSATTSTSTEVRVTSGKEREETDAYTIDVAYPQFSIPSIDADIKSKVDASISEFKNLTSDQSEPAVAKSEFTGTFENTYVGPDVVSVKLILSQYAGGAHPLTLITGLNYDRATGRQLLQDDAFKLIGMSVAEVSTKTTTILRGKLGDALFEEGVNSNSENFSSFLISKDTVTFIFQEYQAASYAAGPQEVSFERKQ